MKNIYLRMADALQNKLSREGLPQDRAIAASLSAVDRVRADLGGSYVYLPLRHPTASIAERSRRIRAAFTGRNKRDVAREFGVSTRYVHKLCTGK